jgi:hypothetical protein
MAALAAARSGSEPEQAFGVLVEDPVHDGFVIT